MSTPSILSAIKKLKSLLTPQEKLRWGGIASFALVVSLLEVLTATVIVVFAQVLNQPESGKKYLAIIGITDNLSPGRTVFYISLLVGGVYLVKNILAIGETFFQNFSIQNMKYHFTNRLLHRYAKMDYGFYLTRNSSLGLQVISGDMEVGFSGGMIALATVLSEGVVFLALVSMIIYMNSSLALVVGCLGVILSLIFSKLVLPKFYRWGQKVQKASLRSQQHLMQFFHAFKEIVLLGKSDSFVDAYKEHSYNKCCVDAIQTATNNTPRMIIELLFVGLFVITIATLCSEKESPLHMLGTLGGYLYAGFRLMPGLNRMINQVNILKGAIPSIERLSGEYTLIGEEKNYEDVPDLNFLEEISLKKASFRYLNTTDSALRDISFEINKGENIGIVGETGSGKSTLVDLILGLLRPYEGSILVDGQYPVNTYQWHKLVGYVPQSIYLVDDTIEANIAFGETTIDHEQLQFALEAAQLEKFVAKTPHGLKTIVGERGVRLSGGERQRIAIARALYHNPQVLVFDEATSALDNATEKRLMQTIRSVSKDRTVIMIAHRLTTLKDCDRIVVMKDGRIDRITTYEAL